MPQMDIFVATEEEIWQLDEEDLPMHVFPWIDMKVFGEISLFILFNILTDRGDDDLGIMDEFTHISEESVEGPWIARFAPSLAEQLTELEDDRIDDVARQWSATKDLISIPPSWVVSSLHELVALAKRARAESKELFIWICL
jgi:hypothetical protein